MEIPSQKNIFSVISVHFRGLITSDPVSRFASNLKRFEGKIALYKLVKRSCKSENMCRSYTRNKLNLKIPVLVNFADNTRRSSVYNLSYTWSLSMEQTLFVSSFPSLSYQHARTRENVSVLWKKCRIFLQDRLWKISSWSILWTTKEDQTCITWVIHGLSLRNKVCLFLHFLLYHICFQ